MQSLQSTVTLNNGVAMPILGLGVYNSKEETTFAVSTTSVYKMSIFPYALALLTAHNFAFRYFCSI